MADYDDLSRGSEVRGVLCDHLRQSVLIDTFTGWGYKIGNLSASVLRYIYSVAPKIYVIFALFNFINIPL